MNDSIGSPISRLARPAALAMEPYVWEAANQEIAARYNLDASAVVRFDTNTSPLPPPSLEAVLRQAQRSPLVNEYFDGSYAALAAALADYTGFSPAHMVIGAGADEILDVLAKTFLNPGDRVIVPTPTYAMYRIVSQIMDASVHAAPATSDLSFDTDSLIEAAAGAKAVFLCNPNNPTGLALPPAEVARLIRGVDCLVIVDEAYFEFTGESAAPLIAENPRLIVVRTLSKAFSLAGARIGYALCDPETAALANRMRPPNSISYISAILAEAAVRDLPSMRENVARLTEERAWLSAALRGLGVEVTPSRANFLLTRWPSADAAARAAEGALSHGLAPRTYAGHPLLGAYLRLTVRARAENEALLAALGATALARA
ncbi:MAG TPA: histidinol-phosphate transaminase [Chloroflexota bacterium]|nr:histidinol-phosphate transaminase [Chloroflexota bacterium]